MKIFEIFFEIFFFIFLIYYYYIFFTGLLLVFGLSLSLSLKSEEAILSISRGDRFLSLG